MIEYCRSCGAGDLRGESSLCDDCAAMLRRVAETTRAWADEGDEDGTAAEVIAAARAARGGFDAAEIIAEAVAEAARYGFTEEVKALLVDI